MGSGYEARFRYWYLLALCATFLRAGASCGGPILHGCPGGGAPIHCPLRRPGYKEGRKGIRTIRLRLFLTQEQEKELERPGDLCAMMWNELSYERMKLFKERKEEGEKLTSEDMRETYTRSKYYEKYKGLLGPGTATQIASMNDEAWSSFFTMLKAKKEGRLPPFIKRRVSPPGFWKDRVLRKRIKRNVVRSDRYVLEPVNAGEGYVEITIARGGKIKIRYAGKLRWAGRQGRMIIARETRRWFTYIQVEVGAEASKWYKKGYVRGELKSLRQREPKGDGAAFIDMGLNSLFAIVTTLGDAALVKDGGCQG